MSLKIIVEIILDVLHNISYFIESNLLNIANTINFVIPYAMFYFGQDVATKEGKVIIHPMILIPLFTFIITFFIKSIANKLGKGITVPVPDKRFTEVDEDGEVSVENNRLQELLLYVADVEDWIERKGLSK